MPTDAKTGQPIFGHHASLHSRNRRPFGLTDDRKVGDIQADDLNDGTAAENGYATGNARYLHLQIENNDTSENLALWAYNYAFGSWAQLYLPHGSPANNVGDISEDSVETQAAGTTNLAWVPALWTTIDGAFMVTVPIHGIDRIGFVHGSSVDANYIIRAATSTF